MAADPLVVTLRLDDATQRDLDEQRRRLFPPGRTEVGAHVTLFHALPADLRDDVEAVLGEGADREPPEVGVTGLRSLGRGVAYVLACPELEDLHAGWQRRWRERLTRQDAQPLRLHVTVQNKVEPDEARRTLAALEAVFEPRTASGEAFELWRYAGGPWEHLRSVPLSPRR